jgi:hypothetical protein
VLLTSVTLARLPFASTIGAIFLTTLEIKASRSSAASFSARAKSAGLKYGFSVYCSCGELRVAVPASMAMRFS